MRPYAFTAFYALAAAVAGVAVGELYLRRRAAATSSHADVASPSSAADVVSRIGDVFAQGVSYVKTAIGLKWSPPAAAAAYLPTIADAEARSGLPPNLLARLLDQESHYRPEIINGTVRSSAGAVGIAQLVPKWHPDVTATDPVDSIYYAAQYLASLKRQFGSWEKALAAYNWGLGNLQVAIAQHGTDWLAFAPAETRSYVTGITGDVPTEQRVYA